MESNPSAWNDTVNISSSLDVSSTPSVNGTQPEDGPTIFHTHGIPLLIIICVVSMVVNGRVLASARWIRRPISATLYISFSLAAADAVTSALLCLHLLLHSYLDKVFNISISNCYGLFFEALRLGGIVTTVMHLLLLACNHYLGIVKPLQYQSIMTHRVTTAFILVLWILPPTYFYGYFLLVPDGGLLHETCDAKFITHLNFRISFAVVLLIPMVVMIFIYTHILVIVRRHQQDWIASAERGASCRHHGPRSIGTTSVSSASTRRRHGYHVQHHRRNVEITRNIKAVYTTLLILGSFVVGMLPATVMFVLCGEGAIFKDKCPGWLFYIAYLLVIIKTLANPIIYGARMHEIKEATRRMRAALCHDQSGNRRCGGLCLCSACCWLNDGHMNGTAGGGTMGRRWDDATDSQQLYNSGGSWRGGTRTAVCRLVSNGHIPHLATSTAVGQNSSKKQTSSSTVI